VASALEVASARVVGVAVASASASALVDATPTVVAS
jgi:hypothetical protein